MLKGNKIPLGLAQGFKTNNLTMFLEKEAVFPCHNWSINIARIIWFGSITVDIGPAYVNNWKRFGRLWF